MSFLKRSLVDWKPFQYFLSFCFNVCCPETCRPKIFEWNPGHIHQRGWGHEEDRSILLLKSHWLQVSKTQTRNGPNHHPNFPFCRFPGFCWGSDDFFPPKSSCCARNIGKSQLQSTKPRRPVSLWHMHHVNHPGSRRFGGGMTQKVDGFSEPSPKQSMYGIPVPTCTIAKISQIWLVNIRTLHGWNWKKQILSKWESH